MAPARESEPVQRYNLRPRRAPYGTSRNSQPRNLSASSDKKQQKASKRGYKKRAAPADVARVSPEVPWPEDIANAAQFSPEIPVPADYDARVPVGNDIQGEEMDEEMDAAKEEQLLDAGVEVEKERASSEPSFNGEEGEEHAEGSDDGASECAVEAELSRATSPMPSEASSSVVSYATEVVVKTETQMDNVLAQMGAAGTAETAETKEPPAMSGYLNTLASPVAEELTKSLRKGDKEVLDYLQVCSEKAEFPLSDLLIGPPLIDTVRTEYMRKAKFLSLVDASLELLLFQAKTRLAKKLAGKGSELKNLEKQLYECKRMAAVMAQARELYSQGPEVYERARSEGGLITDGYRFDEDAFNLTFGFY